MITVEPDEDGDSHDHNDMRQVEEAIRMALNKRCRSTAQEGHARRSERAENRHATEQGGSGVTNLDVEVQVEQAVDGKEEGADSAEGSVLATDTFVRCSESQYDGVGALCGQ